jgi:hypothetical protein
VIRQPWQSMTTTWQVLLQSVFRQRAIREAMRHFDNGREMAAQLHLFGNDGDRGQIRWML